MNFADVKSISIGGKSVARITCGGRVLWQKTAEEETGLPSMYQAVAWIGNDPTNGVGAYIDLGFTFDTKARIELGQYVANLSTAYIFGAAENSGKLRCMLTSPDPGKESCILYGSTGSAYISLAGTAISQNAVNDFVFTLESGNLRSYNSTTGSENTSTKQAAYTMTNNLYLLSQNYNGAARFSGISRIAYFRYFDKTNTLVCDLVPCYRKGDGVVGMYDLVRRLFLENVGSKTFEKGDDVNTK